MPIQAAAGLTDPGRHRDRNQDNYLIDIPKGIFIVSDGMGGHAAGGLASKLVVEVLPMLIVQEIGDEEDLTGPDVSERILGVVRDLSDRVREEGRSHPGFSEMGATVVCALIREGHALLVHMGDSRAYLFRQGRLEQQTTDHSIVQILIDNGDITPREAETHPARSQITRYVGMKGEPLPESASVRLRSGDRILLCSDGLTGMLPATAIETILAGHPDPENACRALVDAANRAGGRDNIAVVVVDLG